jgi:hypothetical protein
METKKKKGKKKKKQKRRKAPEFHRLKIFWVCERAILGLFHIPMMRWLTLFVLLVLVNGHKHKKRCFRCPEIHISQTHNASLVTFTVEGSSTAVSAVSGILSTNDKLAPVSVTIVGGVVGCSIGKEIGRNSELEAFSSSSFFFFFSSGF